MEGDVHSTRCQLGVESAQCGPLTVEVLVYG